MATTSARYTAVVASSSFGSLAIEVEELGPETNSHAKMASGQIQHSLSTAPSMIMHHDQSHTHSPAGLAGLELDLTPNTITEGILGPNKDGRVRNPVPSKLKGKTDNNKGSFNVMHMGIGMSPGRKNEGQSKDAAAERDAAARRTSENTASRAKAAQSEKYVPPKKRGLDVDSDGPSASRGSPFSRDDHKQRGRPLAPDETKIEQARLLTLLRSINPVTVVDQICKAVAYFGGIPGAPPPEDGIFPESANTRETGALFIGWLAEIFPDVSARSPELPRDAGLVAGKKKAKHTKGQKTAADVDTSKEPPNSRNGYGFGPAVSAPAWGLPPSLGLVNTSQMTPVSLPEPRVAPNLGPVQSKQAEHRSPGTPAKQQPEELTDGNTSTSKRGRGRPKGSRNKGRGEGGPEGPATTQQGGPITGQPGSESPQAHNTASKSAQPNANASTPTPASFTLSANDQPSAPKSHQGLQYSDQSWTTAFQQPQTTTSTTSQVDDFTPEERAVVETFRHPLGTEATTITASPATASKPPPETAQSQKRKRAALKPKSTPPSNSAFQSEKSLLPVQQNMGTLSNGSASNENPPPDVESAAQAPPPAKRPRQRKPKAPVTNDPPSRTQTVSVVSSATPPIPPSTIPDSQNSASQHSITSTRPPAEGLEAHYERFAGLQQQQNGRGSPVVTQQQIRQQPKPSSIPPQLTTPQLQQQQNQKSQQANHQNTQQNNTQQNVQHNVQQVTQGAQHGTQHGIQHNAQQPPQREEPKMTQTASRPSSTTFYNQRNQVVAPTYSQTYPAHQPSQLYGTHQASPQMSNNSYRSSSTHTLAQASPQFSQAENAYRTASPHAHAQPSPSFSQPDTNFRNPNSHNITQPSPAYSQGENPYRTPSTHSMTQPSSSYTPSRSHTQSQPSHQNHYNHFSDSTYIDLPTLESLGHAGSNNNSSVVNMATGGYGQGIGVGLGTSSRSSASSNTLYGSSSGLNAAFDTNATDLLRGVSRPSSHSNSAYGATSSGLSNNNAFETRTSDSEMREQLLRNLRRSG